MKNFTVCKILILCVMIILLSSCSNNGRAIDPTVWDDIFDVSQELGKGKSISEALGTVK
jgi:hypothetical protein